MSNVIRSLVVNVGANLSGMAKELNKGSRDLQKFGRQMTSMGKTMTRGLTAPLVALGGLAAKAAIDFESAFAGVEKTVDGTTQQLAKLRDGIRQMALEIPSSTTEIAGVAEAAGQLGIATDNILDFTRVMLGLGVATNLSSEEAATALARFANITGMAASDYERLGSVIVGLGNNFATTEAEIVDMATNLASTGALVGLTEAQIMGLSASLSSVGIEAAAGGTAAAKLLKQMEVAAATGSKQLGKFAEVAGVSASDFKAAWEKDAGLALASFIEGLGGLEAEGKNAVLVLEDMGLTEVRLSNAVLALSGAGDLLTRSITMANQEWQLNNALNEETEKRYKTVASQIQMAKNSLNEMAISWGEHLLPYVRQGIDALKSLSERFGSLSDTQKQNIIRMAAFAATLGPAMLLLGKLTSMTGILLGRFAAAGKAIIGVTGALSKLGAGIAAFIGPAGLALAAVAALGGAYVLLNKAYQNSKKPHDTVRKGLDKIAAAAKTGAKEWARVTDAQKVALKSGNAEITHLAALKRELDRIVDSNGQVKEGYEDRAKVISNELANALGIEINLVGNLISDYKDLSAVIDEVIQKQRAQVVLDVAGEAYTEAVENLPDYEQALLDASDIYEAAKREFEKAPSGPLKSAAGLIMQDAKNALDSTIETVNSAQAAISSYDAMTAAFLAGDWAGVQALGGLKPLALPDLDKLTGEELQETYDRLVLYAADQKDLADKTGNDIYRINEIQARKDLQQVRDYTARMGYALQTGLSGMLSGVGVALQANPIPTVPTSPSIVAPPLPWAGGRARGAVIPPNREFLAILGDQKSGVNIETPLSTMVGAFEQSLKQQPQSVVHSGSILVKGVNNKGELVAVVEKEITSRILQNDRRLPNRASLIPIG